MSMELLSEIVKKKYRLFSWQDRRISLDNRGVLTYEKKLTGPWEVKEAFTRTDVAQLSYEGKDREKIQMRLKGKLYVFRFSSKEVA